MSNRAERLRDSRSVACLPWGDPERDAASQLTTASAAEAVLAEARRVAFAAGRAKGEEVSADRVRDELRRIGETVEQLAAWRRVILRDAEQQLVQLAAAIANRILRREISTDRRLLLAMARAALDRLGDTSHATVHLHPADHAAITAAETGDQAGIRIVPDPAVQPGGCLVQSNLGTIDAGIAGQLEELTAMLLDNEVAMVAEGRQGAEPAAA